MLFNSFPFLIFFVVVVVVFFALPQRGRWALLLLASYLFYMAWRFEYIILILGSTLVDYTIARALDRTEHRSARKALLWVSIAFNLGLLAAFKYANFLGDSTEGLFALLGWELTFPQLNVLLPVGISFYTFQTIGYTIDVYRRVIPAERHLGIYALYVAFFPQLVAGPIERSYRLLPQFRERQDPNWERTRSGTQQIMLGLFKKIVVADTLAGPVAVVYSDPDNFSAPLLLIATVFFAFQIYGDFSGYSDIAIGVAAIMGYDLMENFRRPYLATSISDFWRRWHISLSTWFRDYLYIPLGGNRVEKPRWYFNVLVVFVLSGLWHGASWTFVIWGGLHGMYLLVSDMTQNARQRITYALGLNRTPRIHRLAQTTIVFLLVMIGWVLFRAQSISDATTVLRGLMDVPEYLAFRPDDLRALLMPRFTTITAFIFIAALLIYDVGSEFRPRWAGRFWERPLVRRVSYVAVLYVLVFFGIFGEVQFIYFQF